jgi:hypothetical protein
MEKQLLHPVLPASFRLPDTKQFPNVLASQTLGTPSGPASLANTSFYALDVHERLCVIRAGQEADILLTSKRSLLSSSFLVQGSKNNRGGMSQLRGGETVVVGGCSYFFKPPNAGKNSDHQGLLFSVFIFN